MKLCDRCPQAGSCLLNYLGKACHKLRMNWSTLFFMRAA